MLRLFFIFATGCPACESAAPDLERFGRNHPEIPIERVDITMTEWPSTARYNPDATPSYILHRPKQSVMVHEGAMTVDELEDWVQRKTNPSALEVEEL